MNYSRWIGKTFRHPHYGKFVCDQILFRDGHLFISKSCMTWIPARECKRIRIVKRKKSQVLVEALEKLVDAGGSGDTTKKVAREALAAYREKTKEEM